MGAFTAGQVALGRFPFSDLTASKLRPAIVLAGAGCLCVLAIGCANPAPPRPAPARTPAPVITPDLRPMGRVQMVNTNGHFVVVSFANGFMPDLEDRLGVFRNGSKIGAIKITGPQREYNIVAEILSGDPEVQDEVKPN